MKLACFLPTALLVIATNSAAHSIPISGDYISESNNVYNHLTLKQISNIVFNGQIVTFTIDFRVAQGFTVETFQFLGHIDGSTVTLPIRGSNYIGTWDAKKIKLLNGPDHSLITDFSRVGPEGVEREHHFLGIHVPEMQLAHLHEDHTSVYKNYQQAKNELDVKLHFVKSKEQELQLLNAAVYAAKTAVDAANDAIDKRPKESKLPATLIDTAIIANLKSIKADADARLIIDTDIRDQTNAALQASKKDVDPLNHQIASYINVLRKDDDDYRRIALRIHVDPHMP